MSKHRVGQREQGFFSRGALLVIGTGLLIALTIAVLYGAVAVRSCDQQDGAFDATGGITDVMHVSRGTVEHVDVAACSVTVRTDSDSPFSPSTVVVVDFSKHESEVSPELDRLIPGTTQVELRYFPVVLESGGYSGTSLEIVR